MSKTPTNSMRNDVITPPMITPANSSQQLHQKRSNRGKNHNLSTRFDILASQVREGTSKDRSCDLQTPLQQRKVTHQAAAADNAVNQKRKEWRKKEMKASSSKRDRTIDSKEVESPREAGSKHIAEEKRLTNNLPQPNGNEQMASEFNWEGSMDFVMDIVHQSAQETHKG